MPPVRSSKLFLSKKKSKSWIVLLALARKFTHTGGVNGGVNVECVTDSFQRQN